MARQTFGSKPSGARSSAHGYDFDAAQWLVRPGPGRKKPDRPRVFGIGLSKTGTTSLANAMRVLGYSAAHFPEPALMLTGRFDAVDGFDAAFDTPVCAVFHHLDRIYPGSKFIHTVRAPSDWIGSIERHMALRGADADRGFTGVLRQLLYGGPGFDRERLLEAQRAWDAHVRRYFEARPNDLLEMDIAAGHGWDHLCPFLHEPPPATPFPHHNRAGANTRGSQPTQ